MYVHTHIDKGFNSDLLCDLGFHFRSKSASLSIKDLSPNQRSLNVHEITTSEFPGGF